MSFVQSWLWPTVATSANALVALTLTVLTIHKRAKQRPLLWSLLWFFVVAGLCAQAVVQYQLYNHHSDRVLQLEAKFEDKKQERAQAASAILTYLKKGNWEAISDRDGDALDDVLNFIDALGFLWRNGEVSSIELHEYFYGSVRTYCQEAQGYIDDARRQSPTEFENIAPLFEELTRIEAKKIHRSAAECKWPRDDLEETLRAELRLVRKRTR